MFRFRKRIGTNVTDIHFFALAKFVDYYLKTRRNIPQILILYVDKFAFMQPDDFNYSRCMVGCRGLLNKSSRV